MAAKGSPAGSAAPGIARGFRGHAPLENFEILGCLKCILRQVETVKDNKKSYTNLPRTSRLASFSHVVKRNI